MRILARSNLVVLLRLTLYWLRSASVTPVGISIPPRLRLTALIVAIWKLSPVRMRLTRIHSPFVQSFEDPTPQISLKFAPVTNCSPISPAGRMTTTPARKPKLGAYPEELAPDLKYIRTFIIAVTSSRKSKPYSTAVKVWLKQSSLFVSYQWNKWS